MPHHPTVFLIVLCVVCLMFSGKSVLAYAPQTTHANVTDISAEFFNQQFSSLKLSPEEKDWLITGSKEEDTPTRCLNHFYDPIFNKTWQFGGMEYLYPALTAKEWAQNPFQQALYDPVYVASLGIISKSPVFSQANYTWQRALYEYAKGNRQQAFISLGHVLHLLEDMSVPAHTREDAHPPLINSDVYEDYPTNFAFSSYANLMKEINDTKLKPILKTTLNNYFDFLASYSNNYFLSSDTIPPSKYQKPEILFPDVIEVDATGKIKSYLIGSDENNNLFPLAVKTMPQWRFQSGLTLYSIDDPKVLSNYWTRLAKKAVLVNSGVIKLFFEEGEKAKQDPNFIKENEGNILLAALNGINSFIQNIFQTQPDYLLIENQLTTSSTLGTTTTKNQGSSNQTTPLAVTTNSTVKVTSTTKTSPTTKLTTSTTKTTVTTKSPTTTKSTTTTKPVVSTCAFNTSQSPLRNKVILNEIAWMGTTVNSNNEWLELKNISQGEVDLSNWQILDQDNQIKIVLPNNTKLGTQQFLLLERTDDNSVPQIKADFIFVGTLNNQNEGLRLFNANCGLEDEVFAQSDWPGGDNVSKRTLERKSNLTWQTSSEINGTPKQENSSGFVPVNNQNSTGFIGGITTPSENTTTTTTTKTTTSTTTKTTTSTTKPSYPKLLITELQLAGTIQGNRTNVYDEFIEIYNPNDTEVSLSGWYLQKKTSQAEYYASLIPETLLENQVILPHNYFLLAHASSTYTDLADVLYENYSLTDNNTIILKNPNREIVDKIGFGEANDCDSLCALNPEPGQSIQRKYQDGNFLDTDNNANDFELQLCPSPKDFSKECISQSTTTTTLAVANTPALPYLQEFSWHPFSQKDARIVVDFRTNGYPFIPAINNTDNVFTGMVFYWHSDQNASSSDFGIPTEYLGSQDNWVVDNNIPALVVTYPNCQGYTTNSSGLIFTNSDFWCHAPGGARGNSYNWWSLPKDNHFIIPVVGLNTGGSSHFTSDQYVTIGYYGYDNSARSYLKLIAYDPTKFYFQPDLVYHQPSQVNDFKIEYQENTDSLIFSWVPARDSDPKDTLKYEIQYVFAQAGDKINNNDFTRQSWEWSQSQNVPGQPQCNFSECSLEVAVSDLLYLTLRRQPEISLDLFFGIKAVDSEGLKSEEPLISYFHLPYHASVTTTTLLEGEN